MCVRVYIICGLCCPLCHLYPHCPSVLSVPFSPRAISHGIRKIRAGRREMPGILLLFLFFFNMYVCTLSQHARIHLHTHTHSDHTRSLLFYGHSSTSLCSGWLDSFWFSLLWFHQLLVCTYYQQSGFCPFVVFIPFSYYFLKNSAFYSATAQTSGPPSQSPILMCVCGSCWRRPHFFLPTRAHHTIPFLLGLSAIEISWEERTTWRPPDWAYVVVVVSGYCCAKKIK